MNDHEKTLRERFNVDSMINFKIGSIEQGREMVAILEKWLGESITEMRESDLNNDMSDAWNNVRYDMNTARKNIQSQMMKLAKAKIKHNANLS